jgi:hypothetical protein
MTWLSKLIGRDPAAQEQRIATAKQQQREAAELLADVRGLGERNRKRVDHNHLGEGFRAAFYADDRRRHA